MRLRFVLFLALGLLTGGCAIVPQPAELILTGGTVWTGSHGHPTAEAIAVRGGQIIAIGSTPDIQRFKGPRTREIDLHGRLVVPGFSDSHTHFISGGFALGSVKLRDAKSPEEFTRILGEYARTLAPGKWITEGDWDHEAWPGAPLPRREWFDSVTRDNPVAVNRLDGHMIVVNSKALQLAGITRDTKDPAGGTIVRDLKTGEPTGVLKDAAMDLIWRRIPAATQQDLSQALHRAQAHALSRGVTMITDMGSWDGLVTYRIMHGSGDLKLRVYAFVPLASWQRLRDYVARQGSGDLRLRWGGLKGFVDGSLGSTTAWFYQPYKDAPNTSGLIVTDTAKLREWTLNADKAHLQVALHAIGDHANDWALDLYEWLNSQNGGRDRRYRIEHAQHLTQAAIPRFGELGVIPSMQPYHAIDDGRWAEKRIGSERIKTTYAFRSLIDAGARLNFGSDWTVAPIDPLLGIYAAVTRQTIDGMTPGGWIPRQKISVEEALRAYTANNAFGAFAEHEVGTLERTKRGDMVVLSDNILTIDPVRIKDAKVDYTIINGEVVFERK